MRRWRNWPQRCGAGAATSVSAKLLASSRHSPAGSVRDFVWPSGKQWKTTRRRRAALLALGVRPKPARNTARSSRGPWYLAHAKALSVALPTAYFKSLGLPNLEDASERSHLEPPCTDPYARWCGRGQRATAAICRSNALTTRYQCPAFQNRVAQSGVARRAVMVLPVGYVRTVASNTAP
jgi:hypothetical protein